MTPITEQEIALIHRYVCEGIGDPKRLMLLYLVAEHPCNVTELTEALDVAQPTVSHHLRILRERGLVTSEREGTSIYYSLGDPRVLDAIEIMRGFVADLLSDRAKVVNRLGRFPIYLFQEADMSELTAMQMKWLADTFGDRMTTRRVERKLYSHDIGEMPSMIKPLIGNPLADAVVQPVSEEEIIALVKWAGQEGDPLDPTRQGNVWIWRRAAGEGRRCRRLLPPGAGCRPSTQRRRQPRCSRASCGNSADRELKKQG